MIIRNGRVDIKRIKTPEKTLVENLRKIVVREDHNDLVAAPIIVTAVVKKLLDTIVPDIMVTRNTIPRGIIEKVYTYIKQSTYFS